MRKFHFLRDRDWREGVARNAFGRSFQGFAAFAAATGAACYILRGPEVFSGTLTEEMHLLAGLLPRASVALAVAAIIWAILPRDRVASLVGQNSGLRGLIVALLAGTITPGGPSSAYALLGVLAVSGADRGALVCYITAWATLGLQRVVIWDVPFMGTEFALLRFAAGCTMPILAGLIARRITWNLTFPQAGEGAER
ncbi:hypothetical protein [Actibacterium sp. MT2.3-13A]|uniref:hypothetical protein n=1 Tax=Actibacterium sp. MT2.3-13A TaxID=2828332 RepID=UPI001BA54AEB|nr:hypothetical protein [Actibacterium sp. MT2.3-13A]